MKCFEIASLVLLKQFKTQLCYFVLHRRVKWKLYAGTNKQLSIAEVKDKP